MHALHVIGCHLYSLNLRCVCKYCICNFRPLYRYKFLPDSNQCTACKNVPVMVTLLFYLIVRDHYRQLLLI